MAKKFRHRIVSLLMALMLLSTVGAFTTYAAEVETRAGVETFRLNNNYEVGAFTFSDRNTTPRKTVEGRYLYTYLNMTRSSSDQGIASSPIKVTVRILDASTLKQIGGTHTYIINPNSYMDGGFETDLGYAGRQIYVKFEATSYGASNGNERAVYVQRFMVNTSNTQGTYFD